MLVQRRSGRALLLVVLTLLPSLAGAVPAGRLVEEALGAADVPLVDVAPPKGPLRAFEPNLGQWPDGVVVGATTDGGALLLDAERAEFRFSAGGAPFAPSLRMRPIDGRALATLPGPSMPGVVHRYGAERAVEAIPRHAGAWWLGVWPGVDVLFRYGADDHLEFDLHVAPGADPSAARFTFAPANLSVGEDGALLVRQGPSALRLPAPVAYQLRGEERAPVDARYQLDEHGFGFSLGSYDAALPLVIDPLVVFSTYLPGGTRSDLSRGLAVDDLGASYVAGDTWSTDFPTANATQPAASDERNAFVVKLTPDGRDVVYATYLGGSRWDHAADVDVDARRHALVVGTTESTGAPFSALVGPGGGADAFVAELDADGRLVRATRIGGASEEEPADAAWSGGEAVVALSTLSSNFPVAAAFQPTFGGVRDAAIVRLRADLTLRTSSYAGGAEEDWASGLAVGPDGTAYLGVSLQGAALPALNTGASHTNAYVVAVGSSGARAWARYFSGDALVWPNGLATDGASIVVAGGAWASDLATTPGVVQPALRDVGDGFVARLEPDGALRWLTYLGATDDDGAAAVAIAADGAVVVAGSTRGDDMPLPCTVSSRHARDAYVLTLAADGSSVLDGTFLGGDSAEYALEVKQDAADATYVLVSTYSGDYPRHNTTLGGGESGLTKLARGDASSCPALPPRDVAATAGPLVGEVTLTWSAPASGPARAPVGYRITRTTDARTDLATWDVDASTFTFLDEGLALRATYRYRIASLDVSAPPSEGPEVLVRTLGPPDAPRHLRLQAEGAGLALAWEAGAEDGGTAVVAHRILRREDDGPETIRAETGAAPGWRDEGIVAGVRYAYRVVAITSAAESAPSAPAASRIDGLPEAPRDLVATPGERRIVLTWGPPATGPAPAGYRIWYDALGAWRPLADVAGTRYAHALYDGASLTYRVAAINDAGEGPWTAPASATAFAPVGTGSRFTDDAGGFTKQNDLPYTEVRWEPGARALAIHEQESYVDGNELMRHPTALALDSSSTSFTYRAIFYRDRGFHHVEWPLALAPEGETNLEGGRHVIGVRYREYSPDEFQADVAYEFQAWYRDGAGALHSTASFTWVDCPFGGCDYRAVVPIEISYDADTRTLRWLVQDELAGLDATYVVGSAPGDGFRVNKVAVASGGGGGSTITYYVDDLNGIESRVETAPSAPYGLALDASVGGRVTLSWSPPFDNGTAPLERYVVYRDGARIAETTQLRFEDAPPRWTTHTYVVRAVNELGEGIPATRTLVAKVGLVEREHSFDAHDEGFFHPGAREYGNADWDAAAGRVRVDFDGRGGTSYVRTLPTPFTRTSGNWTVSARWQETTRASNAGTCALLMTHASQPYAAAYNTLCFLYGSGSAAEGRAPSMWLYLYDIGHAKRIEKSVPVPVGAELRLSASHDVASRTVRMAVHDSTGKELGNASAVFGTGAYDSFRFETIGVGSGDASWSGALAAGVGWVDDIRVAYRDMPVAGILPAPTGLVATRSGIPAISLSWSPPPGDAPQAYRVYRASDNGPRVFLGETSETSFLDAAPTATMAQNYTVSAVVGGDEGLLSREARVPAMRAPLAPPGLAATRGPALGQITLAWSAPASESPIERYLVYRGPYANPTTLVAETLEPAFVDAGLTQGALYHYRVRAVSAVGTGDWSASVSARAPGVPAAPAAPRAISGPRAGDVTLLWDAPLDDGGLALREYQVYRDGQPLALAAGTTYVDAGVPRGEAHAYAVAASNEAGWSARSAATTGRPPDVPAPPANLTARRGAALGVVELAWSAPPDILGILGYRVYRANASGGAYALLAETTELGLQDAGLPTGSAWSYRVSARNELGEGNLSAAVVGRPPQPPSVPRDVKTASGPEADEARISWSPPADDGGMPVTAYRVYRAPSAGGAFQLVAETTNLTYSARGIPAGGFAYLQVSAVSDAGEGNRTATHAPRAPRPPGPPASTRAGSQLNGVMVTWAPPADTGGVAILGYRLLRENLATGEVKEISLGAGARSHLDPAPVGAYEYSVRAVNVAGPGTPSAAQIAVGLP